MKDLEKDQAQDIEDIVNEEWEEAVKAGELEEGGELPDPPDSSGSHDFDDDDIGDDDEGQGDQPTKTQAELAASESATRKYAGQFNTPEELEAAYIASLQKPAEPQPRAEPEPEKLRDLSESELNTISEHDMADETTYVLQYCQKKMQERDLQPHEVKALRSLDQENGTDHYGDYRSLQTERRVMAKISPVLKPLADQTEKQRYEAFRESELKIDESNKAEFGDRFDDLEKKSTNVELVQKVLQASSMASVIIALDQQGQRALAHKMLLREIAIHGGESPDARKDRKRRQSVSPDVGSGGKGKKPEKQSAASIEEAFDMAFKEHSDGA